MRQVPQNKKPYLIIGNGKLAKNFSHVFTQKNISYNIWNRSQSIEALDQLVQNSATILLCISDSAIEEFYNTNLLDYTNIQVIHFSGSLHFDGLLNFHPMNSFSEKLNDWESFNQIPFASFSEDHNLQDYIPELENPSFFIPLNQKANYHAFLAATGNLCQWIWEYGQEFLNSKNLEISKAFQKQFLLSSLDNWMEKGKAGISGPISRKDSLSIKKNMDSLKGNSLYPVYESIRREELGENNVESI